MLWPARFKIRFRVLAMLCSIALIAVLAVPAWNRLRTVLTLEHARRAMRKGELETALDALDGLHRADPKRNDVCYLLGVTNRRLGRFEEAFRYLQRAEDLGWPLEDLARQRYMARFQAGDIDGTREYLQRLIDQGAGDEVAEEVYEALAKGFLAEFRLIDAVVVLDHWIAWRPDVIQPRLWRAELFEEELDWKAAAEQYRKVVEIDPGLLEARLHLANTLLADNQLERARVEYQEARRLSPEDVLGCLGIAQCDRRLGNTAAAKELLQQVLEAEPDGVFRFSAYGELGQIALDAFDYEQAAAYFEAVLAEDPRDVPLQIHHALGTAYSRLGRTEEAKVHFQRADRIREQHRRMRKLAQVASAEPSNVDARFEMAKLLLDMGHDEEASRWLLMVVHLDPQHARARAALADFFASRDMHELARMHRRFADQGEQADHAEQSDSSQTRPDE